VLDAGVERPLVGGERGVDRQVAVDRRDALETVGRVGGDAAHGALERERAGLGADDVEPRGLGDQAGGERAVALERGERAQAPVLLRADREQDDLAVRRVGPQGGQGVEGGDDPALHVHAAAAVHEAAGDRARPRAAVRPRVRAGRDDVDVPVDRQPWGVGDGRRERDGEAPQLRARRLLAGVVGVRAQPGEVVAVQVGLEPERRGQLAEALERGAFVARDARNLHERRDVARDRGGVEAPERGVGRHAQGVARAAGRAVTAGCSAATRALRTPFEIART
jgi:hypothetical protein